MQSILEKKDGTPSTVTSDHSMVPSFLSPIRLCPQKNKTRFFYRGAVLKNLFGVQSLESQTYIQMTEKLSQHFTVSQHIVAARYGFFIRQMKSSQPYKEHANLFTVRLQVPTAPLMV